jgi:hypothetical protein
MMDTVTGLTDARDERDGSSSPIGGVEPETRSDEPSRPGRWRRLDKGLLVASLAIAIGLVLVIRGLAVGITGDERVRLPDLIEEVEPVPEAVQVLNQSRVFVDLDTGYTGVLVIDGTEIETVDIQDFATQEAGQQVDLPPVTIFEGGNSTLTFIPNDDAPITGFTSGLHRVEVIYWEIEVGRQRARSFTWTFTVV